MSTAPNPFLLASTCSMHSFSVEKYGRTIFCVNVSLMDWNADLCSSVTVGLLGVPEEQGLPLYSMGFAVLVAGRV